MSLYDQHPLLSVLLLVFGGGYVCWRLSDVVLRLAQKTKLLAIRSGEWAVRAITYTGTGVVAGLFALVTIFILGWTDQNILSFSFFVLFPGDRVMRFLAGLAYTLCEIMIGHLCAESIGISRCYLNQRFSPRQRAVLFLFCAVTLTVLLGNEYGLAYRRALLMATTTTHGPSVFGQHTHSVGLSADVSAMAHTSGLVAFAVGLADALIGITLGAAWSVIADVTDAALRIVTAAVSVILRITGIIIQGAGRLLRFPLDVIAWLRNMLKWTECFQPLGVFFKVFLLGGGFRRLSYPQAVELLRLAAELRKPDLLDEVRRKLIQEFTALLPKDPPQNNRPQTDP